MLIKLDRWARRSARAHTLALGVVAQTVGAAATVETLLPPPSVFSTTIK
jgi:hypothetical protein